MHRIIAAALIVMLCTPWSALADSSGPVLNIYRAYPPSCLSAPLPSPSGPISTAHVALPTVNGIPGSQVGTEVVTVIFWRTPCDGGASALLGEIVRDQALQGSGPQPVFGGMSVTQGGVQGGSRLASDPNTTASDLPPGFAIPDGIVFVFENLAGQQINYSDSVSVTINGLPPVSVTIPAYGPSQYPDAGLSMQISGYQTGNFADPVAGGQGVQVEVAEAGSGFRTIVLAWYTYDTSGTAYWLFNSETFSPGDRSVSLPLGYYSGGAFVAGNGAPALWGNVTVSFPDCDHMTLSYQSAAGLPSGTPQGAGTRTFTRITSINGATCN
jgi:hypothetical protein